VEAPALVRAVLERVAGWRAVVRLRAVLTRYDAAGGGLAAGGLAYAALFALLPAILLIIGLAGLVVRDPARQAEIVSSLASHLPPLRDLFEIGLRSVSDGAVQYSLIGVVGLVWGASRFYIALDDAFSRVFRDEAPRGLLVRTARGVLSVGALVGAFLGAIALTSVASFLEESLLARGAGDATRLGSRFISPVLAALVLALGVGLVYRFVPPRRPPWSAVALPAIVVGIGLAAFTDLFVYLTPRLVGSLAVYGAIAAVFAALIWLSTGFQVLLLGAGWVRERMSSAIPTPEATSRSV